MEPDLGQAMFRARLALTSKHFDLLQVEPVRFGQLDTHISRANIRQVYGERFRAKHSAAVIVDQSPSGVIVR
jgi:hypothetical protein